MEQVLANLFTNAMKYGTGKLLHIAVSAEGGRVKLRDGSTFIVEFPMEENKGIL